MTPEQKKEEWEDLKCFNDVGPTVEEYLNMEEQLKKFLKKLTVYENEKLRLSRKQKTLNYIVVNSQTAEKLKEILKNNKKEKL